MTSIDIVLCVCKNDREDADEEQTEGKDREHGLDGSARHRRSIRKHDIMTLRKDAEDEVENDHWRSIPKSEVASEIQETIIGRFKNEFFLLV